jgi:translation initiation factor 1A
MTKNKGSGGKFWKRLSRASRRPANAYTDDHCILPESKDQLFAFVKSVLGNFRFTVQCSDDVERLAILRGNMRNRVWVNCGDLMIVSIRPFETSKADIIHRYAPEDTRHLHLQGSLQGPFYKKFCNTIVSGNDTLQVGESDSQFEEDDIFG